jgi:hypothetical protein
VEASSKLIPCLARLVLALFASHSNVSAMIESLAISERKRLCKQPPKKMIFCRARPS